MGRQHKKDLTAKVPFHVTFVLRESPTGLRIGQPEQTQSGSTSSSWGTSTSIARATRTSRQTGSAR
jgi:hypothetical protein